MFIELERQRAALYSQRRRNRRLVEPFLTPGCWRHGPLWTGSMRLGRVIVRETFKDTRGFAHRIGAYRGPSEFSRLRRSLSHRCALSAPPPTALSSLTRCCCCYVVLTACCMAPRRAPTAVDRYLLPAGHSAANLPTAVAAVDRRDRQTDGQTDARPLHRPCSAYYAVSVTNTV